VTPTLREAAAARGAKTRAPSDRPSQRRSAEESSSTPRVSVRVRDLKLRDASEDGGPIGFAGFASVTGQGYEMWDWAGPYTELVSPGAFAATLAQAGLDVPLVLQHNDLRRIARTTNGSLRLSEITDGETTGLWVEADLDPADDDVQYIVPKLRAGLIDEMSFKFMITAGQWSPDWMEYHIDAVDLHRGDVAIVGYGANPLTAGAGLRAGVTPEDICRAFGLPEEMARVLQDELQARAAAAASPAVATTKTPVRITDEDVAHRRA